MTNSMSQIAAEDDATVDRVLRCTADFVNLTRSCRITDAEELDELETIFAEAGIPLIPPHIMGHIIMSWLGDFANEDIVTLEGKKAAVEVADVLGPDHAQALYRFAVLVTKLA